MTVVMSNAEKQAAGIANFNLTGRSGASQIENAQFSNAENSIISAIENGVTLNIPAVAGNRHYDEIRELGIDIAPYAAPAKTWGDVRAERDALLVATDHYALSDVALSSEMSTYRQALRDVPQDNADPTNINWPSKP